MRCSTFPSPSSLSMAKVTTRGAEEDDVGTDEEVKDDPDAEVTEGWNAGEEEGIQDGSEGNCN